MAGNIKGITIEFNGDTTKLDRAIKDINKNTSSIDRELRKVNAGLKFNPTNVDLWRQKQTLLTQKIGDTEKKLALLKQQQKNMDASGVDKNSKEYRELQREIITTESKLKNFKGQLNKIGSPKLKAASEQFKQWGNNLKSAGEKLAPISAAAGAVTAAIGAMTVKAGKNADELNTLSKQYHISTKDLQLYKAAADLVDVPLETIASTHAKLTKRMLSVQKGSKTAANAFERLGINVYDSNGKLRDADTVWKEVIKSLGNIEDETERDAAAMDIFGMSVTELNPLIADGGKTYEEFARIMKENDIEFLDQETIDRANDFNDSLDRMKSTGDVTMSTVGGKMASILAPAADKLANALSKLAGWLTKLDPRITTTVAIVGLVIAVLAPLLIIIGQVSLGIGALTAGIAALPGIFAGIAAGAGAVVSTLGALAGPLVLIGLLIAAAILLAKNWDKIEATAKKMWKGIKTNFDNIKKKVLQTWNNLKADTIKKWNDIKTKIATAISNAKKSVTTTITNMKAAVIAKFTSIRDSAKAWFDKIRTAITDKIKSAKEKAVDYITGLRDKARDVWESIRDKAKDMWDKIKTTITDKIKGAKEKVAEIVGGIKDKAKDTWDSIKSTAESQWNNIKSKITSPIEAAKKTVSGVVNSLKSMFPINIGNILKNVKTPHFTLNWGSKDFGPLGKISYPKGFNVRWYKQGGIFDQPTLAGIGEAGPEAVVPLDTLWDKLDKIAEGSGMQVVINVHPSSGMDEEQLARLVERRLIQSVKNRRLAWQ